MKRVRGKAKKEENAEEYNFTEATNFMNFMRTHIKRTEKWSSYKEHKGNALALRADEGRDKLR